MFLHNSLMLADAWVYLFNTILLPIGYLFTNQDEKLQIFSQECCGGSHVSQPLGLVKLKLYVTQRMPL